MEVLKGKVHGSSLVGLFAVANNNVCFLPPGVDQKVFSEALGTEIVRLNLAKTNLIGLFCAGNSNGLLVSREAEEDVFFNHVKLDTKETALGNLVLANDRGALISEKIASQKSVIEDILGVAAEKATIAGSDLVGSLGVCNSRGAVVHPDVTDEEVALIESVLGVKTDISTVNLGSPHLGCGVVANDNGAVVGEQTTVHELVRIQETLD